MLTALIAKECCSAWTPNNYPPRRVQDKKLWSYSSAPHETRVDNTDTKPPKTIFYPEGNPYGPPCTYVGAREARTVCPSSLRHGESRKGGMPQFFPALIPRDTSIHCSRTTALAAFCLLALALSAEALDPACPPQRWPILPSFERGRAEE